MSDHDDNGTGSPPDRPDHFGEQLTFGDVNYPWRSPHAYDGPPSPAPRRAELLGDAEDAWWADVTAWSEWAITTFRLSRWLPPCWLRHTALVDVLLDACAQHRQVARVDHRPHVGLHRQ